MEKERGKSKQLQALLKGLHTIQTEISELKKEVEDLANFSDEFKEDVTQ